MTGFIDNFDEYLIIVTFSMKLQAKIRAEIQTSTKNTDAITEKESFDAIPAKTIEIIKEHNHIPIRISLESDSIRICSSKEISFTVFSLFDSTLTLSYCHYYWCG